MQIHQAIPYGLSYSVVTKEFAEINLSESSVHDEFEWEEASECCDETIAPNLPIHQSEMNH